MRNKCEHKGKWLSPYKFTHDTTFFHCIKCHRFYATIRTYGVKLNNKFGITSEITGWWTFREILKRNNNAQKEGGYIRTVHHEPKE